MNGRLIRTINAIDTYLTARVGCEPCVGGPETHNAQTQTPRPKETSLWPIQNFFMYGDQSQLVWPLNKHVVNWALNTAFVIGYNINLVFMKYKLLKGKEHTKHSRSVFIFRDVWIFKKKKRYLYRLTINEMYEKNTETDISPFLKLVKKI